MSYPIYKGQNPKHLVDDTKAIVDRTKIPTLKSASTFGNQMICIANYFLSKEVRETGINSGKFIDEWNRDFANNDDDFDKQAAWCTIFVWKIANEAAKVLQCTNPLPDYKQKFFVPETGKETMVWGNARNTVEYLKQRGIKFTKTIPVPGCMMFRNSKSSSSSGHWGIVTDVTKDKFRTIEGNITLSDGADGVGYWEYDNSEIINPENGILFANVQDNPGCSMELKPYQGWICPVEKIDTPKQIVVGLPKCIKKNLVGDGYSYYDKQGRAMTMATQGTDGKWYAWGTKVGEGWVDVTNCDYKYDSPVVETQKPKTDEIAVKDYSPSKDTKNPPAVKKQICRDKIITLPTSKKLQHYRELQNPNVLSDILGANTSDNRLRNGSALWYNNTTRLDPGQHTGFGIFRDSIGNIIYVLNMNQPQSQAIVQNGMVYAGNGSNILKTYLAGNVWNSGGWIERYRDYLLKDKYKFVPYGVETERGNIYMPPESNLNHVVDWTKLPERNLFEYLKAVENLGQKLTSPIIIQLGERTEPPSLTKVLDLALGVVTVMCPALGIKIPPQVLSTTKSLVAFNSTGGVLLKDPLDFIKNVAQLAEFYAPETVKGVTDWSGRIVDGLGKNIKVATQGIEKFVTDNQRILVGVLDDAEKSLGFDKGEIEKLFNRYKGGDLRSNLSFDITKIVSKTMDLTGINKTVENAQNMLMLDQMRRSLSSEKLIMDVMANASAFDVPILQDLFSSAGSNGVLATFPKIQQFTASLLENQAVKTLRSGETGAEITAGLIGQAFGLMPADPDILRPLQLESLISKALVFKNNNDPFVMPESIGEEYKECYQFVIEQDTGANVINCPTGWVWDKQLKKCVNPNAKVGYTGTTTSNTSGVVTGGQLPTEKINIDLPKEDKKVSTGTGFDFARDTGFSNPILDLNFDLLKKTGNPEIEIGKPLPIEYVPPCLVKEGANYYYYPYGTPKAKEIEIVTQRPSEKILTVAPKDLPTSPTNSSPTYSGAGFTQQPLNPSLIIPSGIISPLTAVSTIPSGGVPSFTRGNDLAMPLPTLNDLPEKILVFKSGNKWIALIDGKQYDFDPINCKIIGYQEPYKEENEEKIVSKKDLENEIARREQERQEAEKKIREEAELRKQQATDQAKEIENQKRLDELRRQNELLIDQNKKLQTEVVTEAKTTSNTEEMNKLVDIVNLERKRANEALAQLNAERTKGTDDTAFQKQLDEMRNNIIQEQNRNNALNQEIEILKNKPVQTVTTAQPTTTVAPTVNNANCTDCDKLGMPKVVEKHEKITYGFPEQNCHSCPQCGGCEDECDCY